MIAQRRPDGSFVINNGLYHVPNEGEWKEQWETLNSQWEKNPDQFEQLEDFRTAAVHPFSRCRNRTAVIVFERRGKGIDGNFFHIMIDRGVVNLFKDFCKFLTRLSDFLLNFPGR